MHQLGDLFRSLYFLRSLPFFQGIVCRAHGWLVMQAAPVMEGQPVHSWTDKLPGMGVRSTSDRKAFS